MTSTKSRLYATRSGAIRAARQACKRALGPAYRAYEGPDFIIHPATSDERTSFPNWFRYSNYSGASYFELRGPATEEERNPA